VDTQDPEVIRRGDELSGGHYLARPTLAEIFQAAGKSTAIAGSKPVALLQDRKPRQVETVNRATLFGGMTLSPTVLPRIVLSLGPFPEGPKKSSYKPNEPRDEWTTRALLGPLWSNAVPAYSLLWLSEPDASQHAAGPGSPQGLAAVESSDRKLGEVLAALEHQGLRDKTDVLVVSDHGFSTVAKSVDVCAALREAGFRAQRHFDSSPKKGDILVVGQGGSVLFYIVGHSAKATRKLVDFLQEQDFAGVVFTRTPMDNTFTLEQGRLNLPQAPDIVLSMRWSADRSGMGVPGLQFPDGESPAGHGSHGSLSRFDVHNMLVGAGPDFKSGYTDELPSGNIDVAPTVLWLLGVDPAEKMDGRVLSEALTVDAPPAGKPSTRTLEASRTARHFVWRQYLQISQVNQTVYLDEGNGNVTRK
jgi:arylsulfatase A-like enzyme